MSVSIALRWQRLLGAGVLGLAIGVGALSPSIARERATEALSRPVYDALQSAQGLIGTKAYGQALRRLADLRKRRLSRYEQSQVWNLEAYVHFLAGDRSNAIRAYRKVLEYDALSSGVRQSTLYTLAQLYFAEDRYDDALSTLRGLLSELDKPAPSHYLLLGQVLYQMGNHGEALSPVRKAVALQEARGQVPEETTLLLLNAIHHELGQFAEMERVLLRLIEHYPKPAYMLALAGVYGELGKLSRQLAVYESLYERSALRQAPQLIQLAQLYLHQGLPYKAARMLEASLETGSLSSEPKVLRLLAQAWQAAAEPDRAVAPLTAAAEASRDARLYLQLGRVHMQASRWVDAEQALRKALEIPRAKELGQINLLLGIALYRNEQQSAARPAFERAIAHPDTRDQARKWLDHLVNETADERRDADQGDYSPRPEAERMMRELEG